MDQDGNPVNETRWLSDTEVRHSRAYLYWLRYRHLREISSTTGTHAHRTDTSGNFTWPEGRSVSSSARQYKGCELPMEGAVNDTDNEAMGERVDVAMAATRSRGSKVPAPAVYRVRH